MLTLALLVVAVGGIVTAGVVMAKKSKEEKILKESIEQGLFAPRIINEKAIVDNEKALKKAEEAKMQPKAEAVEASESVVAENAETVSVDSLFGKAPEKKEEIKEEKTYSNEEVVYFDELFGKKEEVSFVELPKEETSAVNDKKFLKKARGKLRFEAFVRSVIVAAMAGFFAMFVASAYLWLKAEEKYWIAFIVFGAVFAVTLPIVYFAKYRPKAKDVAKRIDAMGLEERLITMEELKGEDSFMAVRQRADAIFSLNKIKLGLLKLTTSISMVIILCLAFVLGGGMTTVSGLAAAGYLGSGKEWADRIKDELDPEKTFEVRYSVVYLKEEAGGAYYSLCYDEGGVIEGNEDQVVVKGESSDAVMAEAMDGYAFAGWSDGYENPYRIDEDVQENIDVSAYFVKMTDSDEGDGNGQGQGEGEPGDSSQQGDEGGEPSDQQGEEGEGDSNVPSDQPGSGAGGKYEEKNQVLDGKTYYGDTYENAKSDTMEKTSKDGEMPSGVKKIISDYFDAIKKSGSN